MRIRLLGAAAALALLSTPCLAQTQEQGAGIAAAAVTGAVGGAIVGGPVGAAIGGIAGAFVGGVASQPQPRYHQYVVQPGAPAYAYGEPVTVGSIRPAGSVGYHAGPQSYAAGGYGVVDERTVLVDPRTGRIVREVR